MQECSTQSIQMEMMVMIVSHLVTMAKARSKGLVRLQISNDLSISIVLLVESLYFNLLSVAQLCDLGFKCIFSVDDVEIISVDGSNLILKGFRYENLYLVDINAIEKHNCQHVCSLSLA